MATPKHSLFPLSNFGSILRVIVHLEDPVVPGLELPGCHLEMLLQYFYITFFHHDAIYVIILYCFFLCLLFEGCSIGLELFSL